MSQAYPNVSRYTFQEITAPEGENAMPPREAYAARKMYKDVPYFIDLPNPLRSLYEKLYFGRVDTFQNGILIKCDSSLLKQINSRGDSVFALNFVADAFTDLRDHMRRVGDHGLLNAESFYYNLSPMNGLERMQNRFTKFYKLWSDVMGAQINSDAHKRQKVVDFRTYVEAVLSYMAARLLALPLTTTGFVVSNASTPMMSGISIEMAATDYAVDRPKVKNYILDPNFRYFVRAARKYGFYVDRNGPWKLVADPFSSPMLAYMSAYDVTKDTFFSTYYDRTWTLDYDHLQKSLKAMYNQFVVEHPTVVIKSFGTVGCPGGEVIEKKVRRRVTDQMIAELGDIYWLDLYFRIRALETNTKFTNYSERFQTMTDVYRAVGREKAVKFINNEIKPYLYNLEVDKTSLTKTSGPVRIGSVSEGTTAVTGMRQGSSY